MGSLYNDPATKKRRRQLRQRQTEAERLLWSQLRRRQVLGYRFLRQYSVDHYVLDFYCPAAQLAIELDGGVHTRPEQRNYDSERADYLTRCCIRVIRFWNEELYDDIEHVIERMEQALQTT